MTFSQVSAPALQECTNSHAFGIAHSFSVGPFLRTEWPETAEDYGVFAIRLQHEEYLRNSFNPPRLSPQRALERTSNYTRQLVNFLMEQRRAYQAPIL